jgi:hypothetical protein
MRAAALLAAAVCGGALAWRWRRDQENTRRWRAGLLRGCERVLDQPRTGTDRAGMPTLSGYCEGLPLEVALILDHAGYRKLPVIWLSATCAARLRPGACFDALARPQGTEFFSPSSELPVRLESPPSWPPHVSLRADREAVAPLAVVRAGETFFAQDAAKELVVSPRGARLVQRVAEARRPEYLVLRQARFDLQQADPETVDALARAVVRLARALAGDECHG